MNRRGRFWALLGLMVWLGAYYSQPSYEGRVCVEDDLDSIPESAPVLRIDGVVIAEILERHLAMTG